MLNILKKHMKSKKRASEIFGAMKTYPQVLVNVKVANERKKEIMTAEAVHKILEKTEKLLDKNGRVLLRASGTEPLIRIMIEGENQDIIAGYAKEIEEVIGGIL